VTAPLSVNMLTSGVPGQQGDPSCDQGDAGDARATVVAMPVSAAPNSHGPTNDGTISNATPVAASLTAASTSTRFIASIARPFVREI
jgi:hypothetical protein